MWSQNMTQEGKCDICRRRKVKCDEVHPVCGKCKKSRRQCSYTRGLVKCFKFVEANPKPYEPLTDTSPQKDQLDQWYLTINTGRRTPLGDSPLAQSPDKGNNLAIDSRLEKQCATDRNTLTLKWHRTNICLGPALALSERRSIRLAACLEEGSLGARMKWFGAWITLVPQRIGFSQALDHSAQLMTAAHAAIIRHQRPSTWIDANIYARGLQSLRKALLNPIECFSSETLAAVAILYHLEATLGCPYKFSAIHHAGGIARLLEIRGPTKCKSEFEMAITRYSRGPVVGRALVLGVPCFLTSPSWMTIIHIDEGSSQTVSWAQKLMIHFMYWSELALEKRKYCNGQLSLKQYNDLKDRLATVELLLSSINAKIEEQLTSEAFVTQIRSIQDDPIHNTAFNFKDYAFATMVMIHASFTLAIDRMSSTLNECDNTNFCDEIENTSWNARNSGLLDRIIQSYEYAWKMRPMGATFMLVPLTMAFSYARPQRIRTWILQAMNDLDEHYALSEKRFTAASVSYLAKLYTGEVSPVVSTTSVATKANG
ncbi:hypothetical protein GGI43DRAFT_430690 [Trichoderma evansii]